MITRITSANRDNYAKLFEKARTDLNISNANELDSLDAFFTRIKDLAIIDPHYTILPLDEEVFAIDADRRTIEIPRIFNTHGLCVQGDHRAEVVFFSIDRYFDSIDLNTQNIFIQWELADGTKGLSPEYLRDVTSQEGKLIFGWVLDSDITAVPGRIKFAIRFYKGSVDDVTGDISNITYSFSTLPAIANVNASLNLDLSNTDTLQSISKEALQRQMLERLENSSDIDLPIPAPPVFLVFPQKTSNATALVVDSQTVNKTTYKGYADIKFLLSGENNRKILWAYSDVPTGTSYASYSWQKFNPSTDVFETITANATSDNFGITYITVAEAGHQDNMVELQNGVEVIKGLLYKYDEDDNKYYIVSDSELEDFKDEDGEYDYNNLYRRVGYLVITEAGVYRVTAKTISKTYTDDGNDEHVVQSEFVRNPYLTIHFFEPRTISSINSKELIPAVDGTNVNHEPYNFTFTEQEESTQDLTNHSIVLYTNVRKNPIVDTNNEWSGLNSLNPQYSLNGAADAAETVEYKWYKGTELLEDETSSTLTITPDDSGSYSDAIGYYYAKAVNTRNGLRTAEVTNKYRLTYKPSAPVIPADGNLPTIAELGETEVALTVTPQSDFDKIYCIWGLSLDDEVFEPIIANPITMNKDTSKTSYTFTITPRVQEANNGLPAISGGEYLQAKVWTELNGIISSAVFSSETVLAGPRN